MKQQKEIISVIDDLIKAAQRRTARLQASG
jgi:hypothetical protein